MRTIKIKLSSISSDVIKNKIKKYVDLENYLTSVTTLFIKGYVLNCKTIPFINLNFISTAYNVIIENHNQFGNSTFKKKGKPISTNKDLFETMNTYYKNKFSKIATLNNDYTFKNMSHIIRSSATQLLICYRNNVLLNYVTYINKFVNYNLKDYKLEGDEKKQQLKELKQVKSDIINNTLISKSKYHLWIKKNKSKIIPDLKDGEELFKLLHSRNDSLKLHPYMMFMNNYFEKNKKKTLQQFPLRKEIGNKHILIGTDMLIETFLDNDFDYQALDFSNTCFKEIKKKCDIGKCGKIVRKLQNKEDKNSKEEIYLSYLENEYLKIKTEIWKCLFNFKSKHLNNKNYTFNNSICTDGYSVSIHQISKNEGKIKKAVFDDNFKYLDELTKNEKKILSDQIIIGVDPGKKNLFQMIDQEGNKFRYTSIERRRELQIEQLNHKLNKFLPKSNFTDSSKSNNPTIFNEYIKNKTKQLCTNLIQYSKDIIKNISFNRYVFVKKTEDKMINNIKEKFQNTKDKKNKDIVLCYGNWSFTKQMRYFYPTPGIGLKKRLSKEFKIYNIDEYNTSKKCFSCGSNNEKFLKIKDPDYNKKRIKRVKWEKFVEERENKDILNKKIKPVFEKKLCHSLLCCQNKNCNKIWSRDINASLNILKIGVELLKNNERPKELQRTQVEGY